jgi:hypothetical protein
VAISTAYRRVRRLPAAAGRTASPAELRSARLEEPIVSARRQRRYARAEGAGDAAATRDLYLDVIVLLSVVMFLVLAVGVGILVLRTALGD